ncbi:hypothetical protein Hypma_007871 [Hypsizygus marmoreus]|uniref:Zn(2)-C6 fungal-type domain-containing protein n=1 Tax=Hypsizygus marmoreus TaxID=39966 RepID=A0A369K223_HYPMA|nr:hypothetical protein Hypma_007871 [Hypsizygus marmoreus]
MSSETSTRPKRNTSSNSASDGDHRKRRRNRTTQSCLNCHTSKRMCDRKRPACARCTQLGLSGLCVYEVDDPNQRPESQDENARLLKRVAELEGVIRELKNKPHPRWSQPGSSPTEFDRWNSRSQFTKGSDPQDSASPDAPSPPSSLASSDGGDTPYTGRSLRSSTTRSSNIYPSLSLPMGRQPSSSQPFYANLSPQSTPSPSLMTPTEEYDQPQIAINAHADLSPDFDLASIFLSYPALAGYDESSRGLFKNGHADDSCFMKQHGGHCGCLHESANYNVVLELSVRLRKAADILARSTGHHMGSNCLLNQRISDLDTFTTNTLGSIVTSPEDLLLMSPEHFQFTNAAGPPFSTPQHGLSPRRPSSKSTGSSNSSRSWDLMQHALSPLNACDDSFMSWEPPRRV